MNKNTENLENFEGLAMYPLQPGEVFKTVSGTDNTYAVSNKGRIFNCRRRRFVQPASNTVRIRQDGKWRNVTRQRVIAEAFVPNPDNKPCALKIDYNKGIEAENLCWGEWRETLGKRNVQQGAPHPFVKKKITGTSIHDGSEIHYDSMKEAEKDGYLVVGISNCVRGRKKRYKGYIWTEASDG